MIERFKERSTLIKPLLVPAILYMSFVILAIIFLDIFPASPWKVPVLLIPIIPGVFFALGIVKSIGKLDEMSRKILLESFAVSFAITFFLTFPLGLLELGGVLVLNSVYIGLFMILTCLVAKILISRRYE